MIDFIVKTWRYALGWIPVPMPTTQEEFDVFCQKILKTYGLPNLPSYRNAVATTVMHLGTQTTWKQPRFFGTTIKKAQANEIAYQTIQASREEEKARLAAEAEKLEQAEEAKKDTEAATTTTDVATSK